MPSNPYTNDPAREQRADDFAANLRWWVDSVDTVKDAGEKLLDALGRESPEGAYLIDMLDHLDDVVRMARDRLNADAEDIAAGVLDVPTNGRSAA